MASKRPSYVSIRARQRNIIEGMGTRDLTYAQAAKEFGVTRQELKRFVETKPTKLRSSYNRSPGYAKLYREGERGEVRSTLKVKRITRYPHMRAVKYERPTTTQEIKRQQVSRMVQNLYYKNGHDATVWANYARENNLPSSVDAIILLHNNGKMDDKTYVETLKVWRDNYNIINRNQISSHLRDRLWADLADETNL